MIFDLVGLSQDKYGLRLIEVCNSITPHSCKKQKILGITDRDCNLKSRHLWRFDFSVCSGGQWESGLPRATNSPFSISSDIVLYKTNSTQNSWNGKRESVVTRTLFFDLTHYVFTEISLRKQNELGGGFRLNPPRWKEKDDAAQRRQQKPHHQTDEIWKRKKMENLLQNNWQILPTREQLKYSKTNLTVKVLKPSIRHTDHLLLLLLLLRPVAFYDFQAKVTA